ncbi:MAG TPA: hypothetical protein VNN16_00395, partial [Candidatus Sulfotelmatobacter sp.]|nr:hypothetical protein [Candidatus Sulfotelmatobacter sp.]
MRARQEKNREIIKFVSSLAILHAAQLVTLAGAKKPRVGAEMSELAIICDGGMRISDGKIDSVGSSDEIKKNAADAEIIDAGGQVILPGFVDAHTHPVFAGDRLDDFERRARGESYEQIAAAGGGIWSTVEKTRSASDIDLFEQAKKYASWFLRCGTTTVEAKSGYGLTVDDELKILRVIRRLNEETPLEFAPTFLGAHAIPHEDRQSPQRYVDLVISEMLPRVAKEKLAEFCDVFCEQGYFDIERSREILTAAKKLGLKLRIHADQLSNSGGAK